MYKVILPTSKTYKRYAKAITRDNQENKMMDHLTGRQ